MCPKQVHMCDRVHWNGVWDNEGCTVSLQQHLGIRRRKRVELLYAPTPTLSLPLSLSLSLSCLSWSFCYGADHLEVQSKNNLVVTLSRASEEGPQCDLYVWGGSNPTQYYFQFHQSSTFEDLHISIPNPSGIVWYIGVFGLFFSFLPLFHFPLAHASSFNNV